MSPRFLRRRKTLVLNSGLAVALIVAVGFAYTSIGTSSSSAATKVRTSPVSQGTVVSTVSASGTLVSPSDIGLGFVTGGTLRQLYVKSGDKVKVGEVLAKVDDTTQLESLTTAKNGVAAAKASLAELIQGQTPQQKAASAVQLEQSQAQITSAQNSLDFQAKSNAVDAANLATAVTTAQTAITTAQTAVTTAKATLATDTATLKTDTAANSKSVTSDQSKVSQDTQAVTQAESAVTQAQSGLTQAQQQQTSGALKDSQSLSQAQQQVASAQLSYKSQVAQQAVTDAPPTAAQLSQAQNSVTSAQIQLDSAQRTLDGTVLKSPSNGTIQSISTMVGGTVSSGSSSGSSSSSASSGSTGTSTTSGTTSTGTTSTGTGSTGTSSTGTTSTGTTSTGSSDSTTSDSTTPDASDPTPAASIAGRTATVTSGDTGFVVLTGITGLEVQASFSEDDTASLHVGQGATLTLNALPDSPVNASVSNIASTGTSSSGVVSYTVYLDLKDAPTTIKPGQSGSVSVITAETDNTLYVPSTAVTTAGGVSTVTVVNGSSRTRTVVTLGTVGDSTTAIKTGLTKGQSVALSTTTTTSSGFPTGGFPAGRGTTTGTLTGGSTGFGGGTGRG